MPRVRADNYDEKRSLIMDKAARLFADASYPSVRMMDIAKACGASKSMLYHYFPKKEDLLYAILKEHLDEIILDLIDLLDSKELQNNSSAELKAFIELFIQQSTKAQSRHVVATADLKYLPKKQRNIIIKQEREIVSMTADVLRRSNPNLKDPDYRVFALLLLGAMNSMDLWRNPRGTYSSEAMADIMYNLFLNGFLKAEAAPK